MTLSDKISWIGGMMGLFTGFSVISAIEILYWLWFKVLLHEKDHAKVEPYFNLNIQALSRRKFYCKVEPAPDADQTETADTDLNERINNLEVKAINNQ